MRVWGRVAAVIAVCSLVCTPIVVIAALYVLKTLFSPQSAWRDSWIGAGFVFPVVFFPVVAYWTRHWIRKGSNAQMTGALLLIGVFPIIVYLAVPVTLGVRQRARSARWLRHHREVMEREEREWRTRVSDGTDGVIRSATPLPWIVDRAMHTAGVSFVDHLGPGSRQDASFDVSETSRWYRRRIKIALSMVTDTLGHPKRVVAVQHAATPSTSIVLAERAASSPAIQIDFPVAFSSFGEGVIALEMRTYDMGFEQARIEKVTFQLPTATTAQAQSVAALQKLIARSESLSDFEEIERNIEDRVQRDGLPFTEMPRKEPDADGVSAATWCVRTEVAGNVCMSFGPSSRNNGAIDVVIVEGRRKVEAFSVRRTDHGWTSAESPVKDPTGMLIEHLRVAARRLP